MSDQQLTPIETRQLRRARIMARIRRTSPSARKTAETETIQAHEDHLIETRGVDFLTFVQ